MTQSRLVGGRYELGELIGYGGMAEVHRGRDVRLGRDVAIKVLRADLARDPSFINRFRREAQAAAGLNHPSIVAVYDTGEDLGIEGTAQPYIVMEFVEGRTLRDIIKTEGRLPARRAMEVAADVAGALDFSHRSGLIHRDVKPANVMITPAGAVKVMDFGIARAVADNAATVTQTANVIGTAQYLSPEQARGETVDPRSDVYSLGCLLYELVTGAPPFQGDSPVAVAYQHVRENPTAPSARVPDLPRAVDSIVMKALAKNPQNRYQSAAEMRTDLQRALADQPVNAEAVMTDAERTQFIARTPPLAPIPPRRDDLDEPEPERRGWVWAAIIAALLIVIGVAAFFIYQLGSGGNGTTNVAVPNVIGEQVTAATKQMHRAGLLFQPYRTTSGISSTTSGPCDNGTTPKTEGVVCKLLDGSGQTVSTQSQLPSGTTVFYQTYKQAIVSMPSLLNLDYNHAIAQCQAVGLKNCKQGPDVNTGLVSAGQVAKQSIAPGTSIKPDTTVIFRLSTGRPVLPDVTKMTDSDAKTKLNSVGFTNIDDSQTRTTHHKRLDGKVASESPSPGIAYDKTTQVNLVIWHYVPLPVCSTIVTTPTPPPATESSSPTPTDGGLPIGPPSSSTPTPTPTPTPSTTVVCTTPPG